jgi:hypothetical protein
MFERYTEEARRVVLFARYEASRFGSKSIGTRHLLLGLMREDKTLRVNLSSGAREDIRKQIEESFSSGVQPLSTSVDLPLSQDSKRALAYANEEREALQHKLIDSGHLVLGLLRTENCAAANILRQHEIDYVSHRGIVRQVPLAGSPQNRRRARVDRVRTVERLSAWEEREAVEPAAASLRALITALAELVDSTIEHIQAYSDDYGQRLLKRKPWSRAEALGHLVDWATTHQQWFALALTQPKLVVSGYPQDEWGSAQQYRNFSWPDLVDLWISLNRLLVHVLAQIPEEKVNTACRIGIEEPIPLSELIARYIKHCEDIVGQILAHL